MAIPAHVAIIMDGNGRWARQRHRPRHFGHRAGEQSTRTIVEACARRGVGVLTLFAFSSENWNRPPAEVGKLLELFMEALGRRVDELHGNGISMRFIGDRSRFPESLRERIDEAESLTEANSRMCLNIAVSYGGRWEIVEAARRLAAEVGAGVLKPSDVNEARLAAALCLPPDLPEPDLFIRTGGERRLSNFLLWHLAYTELWFTDCLWPDFGTTELDEALAWFATRERRFGKVDHA